MSVRCQGARVGESPARAVRVAWERYVGEIGGGVPHLSPRRPDLAGGPRGEQTKRPSTVARVRTTHTTRAMRAFEQTPDMTCPSKH